MHKVFISYHHDNDQIYADYLRSKYGEDNVFMDRSLDEAYEGMTDEEILAAIRQKHLRDSAVTIVLIGSETANRKWVDWEINASLRPYGARTRNGLLGIYLEPFYPMPARLQDNVTSGYAVTMSWEEISYKLGAKIQIAYDMREEELLVRNNRQLRRRNS